MSRVSNRTRALQFANWAFIIDVFSQMAGTWHPKLKADVLPLQALDMVDWSVGGELTGSHVIPIKGRTTCR